MKCSIEPKKNKRNWTSIENIMSTTEHMIECDTDTILQIFLEFFKLDFEFYRLQNYVLVIALKIIEFRIYEQMIWRFFLIKL